MPKIDDDEFNRMLNGPLMHPMPMFTIQRLAMALRVVIEAGDESVSETLRSYCKNRDLRDNSTE